MRQQIKAFTAVLLSLLLVSCASQTKEGVSKPYDDGAATTMWTAPSLSATSAAASSTITIAAGTTARSSPNRSHQAVSTPTASATANPLAPYVATMNSGTSKALSGTCVFINVFLSDDTSSFSSTEKSETLDMMGRAVDYLERQAKVFHHEVSIVYNQPDLILDYACDTSIPTDINDNMWAHAFLQRLAAQSSVKNSIKKYKADNIGYIFHINKTGTSYSLAQSERYNHIYDNEAAVIFDTITAEDNQVTDTTEYVYAHEILHLFGAIDLYYPFNLKDERIQLAEKYFPNDIMLVYAYDLDLSLISNVDAYLIGWSSSLEIQNHIFVAAPYE